MLRGCLMSRLHAVSQGQVCWGTIVCRHTETEVKDQAYVSWLLNVTATCSVYLRTDFLRHFWVLPHWDRNLNIKLPISPGSSIMTPGELVLASTLQHQMLEGVAGGGARERHESTSFKVNCMNQPMESWVRSVDLRLTRQTPYQWATVTLGLSG